MKLITCNYMYCQDKKRFIINLITTGRVWSPHNFLRINLHYHATIVPCTPSIMWCALILMTCAFSKCEVHLKLGIMWWWRYGMCIHRYGVCFSNNVMWFCLYIICFKHHYVTWFLFTEFTFYYVMYKHLYVLLKRHYVVCKLRYDDDQRHVTIFKLKFGGFRPSNKFQNWCCYSQNIRRLSPASHLKLNCLSRHYF